MLHWFMNARLGEDTKAAIAAAWDSMLSAISDGASIAGTIKAHGFTGSMVRAYRALVPTADAEWQRAKEQSADAYFEDILDEANNRKADPAFARVRIDALKWLAAKRNPRMYSDKATLDVNVRTVDLTRIIQDANARLIQARQAQAVTHDGEARRVQEVSRLEDLI